MNKSQRSGGEIPHIGRYGGHFWHILVFWWLDALVKQYKWRLAKRLGCDQLREHNGHNHAQRQNILIKAYGDIKSQKLNDRPSQPN